MDSYNELLQKYNAALKTINNLQTENRQLKARLGISEIAPTANDETEKSAINKFSSTDEKIALFRKLFCGREDVFARRWHSKTTGKSGYQPVCENEWVEGLCDKKAYKCSACPNRKLSPLTDKEIYNHLAGKDEYGRDVIGICPMLDGDTCRFLCADFDDADYEKDVSAYKTVCEELQIPVAIERSRSGNGAHAWIFFDEALSAADARKMGSIILTRAMEKRGKLSFKSYDRLFPNQDTMPSGGFGNLIALPLQGLARKNGNSVFVDENFNPYADQWQYLGTVKTVKTEQIETIISQYGKTNELGDLVKETEDKPWETKKKQKLSTLDFPAELKIIRANMLYIPLDGLSSPAINAIKRLAAFKNPDFYRSQAMRMPIYDKPRIICCADITEKYLALPRGCETPLLNLLNETNVNYKITDKTNPGNNIAVSFNGELRDEQQIATDELLKNAIGVLSATTAFGKTVIASYLISQRKVNTLILVHTQALLTQWKKSLEEFLRFEITPPEMQKGRGRRAVWSPVGMLGAQKNTLHGIVDVAIIQSALSDGEAKDFVKDYGMVIVDECHHVSAVNFEKVLKNANAKYVYGLTATPTRQDGHHPIIFMQCGPIRYKVDAKESVSPNLIYDGKSFYPVFSDDISRAKTEVLIVSPFMRKNRLTQIVKLLTPVMLNGITVTVVTRPPEDFKENEQENVRQNAEFLKNYGIEVKYKSEFHQKFTVIDQKITWYGSVNFLSFGKHEESIMRFENYDLAGQLIDTVT